MAQQISNPGYIHSLSQTKAKKGKAVKNAVNFLAKNKMMVQAQYSNVQF